MARTIGRIRRNTGANVLVEAYGEVLMLPGGDVNRWNQKFIGAVKRQTRLAAPRNKRPRWNHYGKPLKDTIKGGKPDFYKTRGGGRLYAAVGSTAPHAYYVDQGTGVYAGSGPYPAKILPPWTRGGASLYEATWRPGIDPNTAGPKPVAAVMIKGQRPQYFFTTGLDKAFLSMRLQRSVASPYKITSATNNPMIEGSLNFFGSTENTPAFRASLAEWRTWRDEAWGEFRALGRNAGLNRRLQGRDRSRVRDNSMQTRAQMLEAARLRRRAEENRAARERRRRASLAEERRRAAEEAENRKSNKRAAAERFKQATQRANEYAREIERLLKVQTSVKANASRTAVQVSWIDSSGDKQSQVFR